MTRLTNFLFCPLAALISALGRQCVFATGGLVFSPPGGEWQEPSPNQKFNQRKLMNAY
jgi:hypothetical protein